MSKRLQVVLEEDELSSYEKTAHERGLTLSEWVRQSLRAAERQSSHRKPDDKVAAIRAATKHRFPAPGIDEMLKEIEEGYRGSLAK